MVCPCCRSPYNKCQSFVSCFQRGSTSPIYLFNCVPAQSSDYGFGTPCSEATLASAAPYECVNNTFQNGGWLTLSNWKLWLDTAGFDPVHLAEIAAAEAFVNNTFGVAVDCLGTAYLSIDNEDIIFDFHADLCQRYCVVSFLSRKLYKRRFNFTRYAGPDSKLLTIGPLPKVNVSCASYGTSPGVGNTPIYPCNCGPISGSLISGYEPGAVMSLSE